MVNKMYASNGVPTEDVEEATFSAWLDGQGIIHTHLSNEIYTKSWSQKRHMKALGVRSGTPDHLCMVKTITGTTYLVFVEMKRQKGGVVSDSQFEFIRHLLECKNVTAFIAEGADQAITYIQYVQNEDWDEIASLEDEFFEKYRKNQQKIAKRREKAEKNNEIF